MLPLGHVPLLALPSPYDSTGGELRSLKGEEAWWDSGLPIEAIADLRGQCSPAATGEVYRQRLRPLTTLGALSAEMVIGTGEPAWLAWR